MRLAESKFSPESINKLTEAYAQDKLDGEDLMRIAKYSDVHTTNEQYIDDYLNSVYSGEVYHQTASKIFVAVNYENCTYSDAVEYVRSGAFYPSNFASLSVTQDVAEQLYLMNVPLRACEGFNYCYDVADISDVKEAFENDDAIFVSDKSLAVKVKEMMKLPDWEDLRNEVKKIMGNDIGELTGQKLEEFYTDYLIEKNSLALFEKVKQEHDKFMAEVKNGTVDNAISSAYEIVTKENILMYCQEYRLELTSEQYAALMSSQNTLHDVFEEWCQNGEWYDFQDIGTALKETADKIQISINRDKQEELTVHKNKPKPVPEQKQAENIKRKSR